MSKGHAETTFCNVECSVLLTPSFHVVQYFHRSFPWLMCLCSAWLKVTWTFLVLVHSAPFPIHHVRPRDDWERRPFSLQMVLHGLDSLLEKTMLPEQHCSTAWSQGRMAHSGPSGSSASGPALCWCPTCWGPAAQMRDLDGLLALGIGLDKHQSVWPFRESAHEWKTNFSLLLPYQ